MIKRETLFPVLGLLLRALFWGSNFSYMKLVSNYIEPIQTAWLRFAIALPPLLLYTAFKGDIKITHFKHILPLSIMAILGTAFYYYAYAAGTSLLYSGIAGLLSGSIPLFSFLAAFFFLKADKITATKAIGMVIGFIGIIIIASPFDVMQNLGSANFIGVAYMLAGSATVGISFVYAKKYLLPLGIPPLALVTYQVAIACLALSFLTDFNGMDNILQSASATTALIIGLSLLGTAGAYMLYYYIIANLGAVSSSSVSYLAPLIALIIGIALGENILLQDYIAAACILTSVILINRKVKK